MTPPSIRAREVTGFRQQYTRGGLVLAMAGGAVVAYAKEQGIMKPLEVLEMQP